MSLNLAAVAIISRFFATARNGRTFQALASRNYRLLWVGQMGHSAALWAETVARSWLIWELTGSATLLALVSFLRALPILFFGLLAGVAANRFDKRKVLIICQSVALIMGPLADAIGASLTLLLMGGICTLLSVAMGVGDRCVREMP